MGWTKDLRASWKLGRSVDSGALSDVPVEFTILDRFVMVGLLCRAFHPFP